MFVLKHESMQTFDAVDGKQARKLKTSSALGDFLDHVGKISILNKLY